MSLLSKETFLSISLTIIKMHLSGPYEMGLIYTVWGLLVGEILPNYTILITYKKTQNNIQNTKKKGAEILYIAMNFQQRVHKKMKNLEWSFW